MVTKYGDGIHDYFTTQDTDLYGGFWHQAFNDGIYDWMYTNAFHFDEEESVIYVSHRHLSRISKISYPSETLFGIWDYHQSLEQVIIIFVQI